MNRPERAKQSRDEHISPLHLSMYADGETPREERAEIEAHLEACPTCSARLEELRSVSATLAALPRTTPSAGVFDKVLAGARSMDSASNAVARERLGRGRSNGPRLREVRLPDMDAPDVTAPVRRRSRWRLPITGALPTIAALLLLALTAGLLLRSTLVTIDLPNTMPTATIPPGETLKVTQSEMASFDGSKQLSFTSVKPTYLPDGARLQDVHVVELTPGVYGLDVTWTMSAGPLRALHLREQPASAPTSDYSSPAAETTGLAWQLGAYTVWRAMTQVERSGWMGVEQTVMRSSGPVQLLLDAQPAQDASSIDVATELRLTSLSLDAPYAPPPINIGGLPSGALLTRAIATVTGAGGQSWNWDVTSDTNAIQVNATISAPDGTKITQITRSGAGVRLDWNRRIYQEIPGPTLYNPPPSVVTVIVYNTSDYLNNGELWNLGPTTIPLPDGRSVKVYDLYRVNTTLPEHVYADVNTGAIVAIFVDTGSSISPGGSGSPQPYVSTMVCAPYKITYDWIIFEPATQSSSLFNTTPPSQSWRQGAVPLPFICGG